MTNFQDDDGDQTAPSVSRSPRASVDLDWHTKGAVRFILSWKFMVNGGAMAAYTLLTIVLTWPLAFNLGTLVPHDLGDPLLSTWTLWWNTQAVPFSQAWWNGPIFFPAQGALSLSDHRVGIGLITTPLILGGVSPIAAHNVAFLLSFVLSAATAYALCLALTGSAGAAFIGGLVFGFNPFRAEHLPHLELLASYWLPVVFLALHQWASTLKRRWLVLLTVSLTLQAITCGYYFFFAGVLIGLWLLWFTPRHLQVSQYVRLGVALALPLVFITPILLAYHDAHAAMGLSRSIHEIEDLSSDVIGLFAAPEVLAFWNTPDSWRAPEAALFPGLTAVLLVAVAWWQRRRAPLPSPWSRFRMACAVLAAVAAAVAMIPLVHGPVAVDLFSLRVSVSDAHKPLSVAGLLFAAWGLTSPRLHRAWQRRSALTFYTLATFAMWVFALGPTARLLGQRILYKAPYAWLMLMPGFRDEFRAPARFAMLAALTLCVAAALAFRRLMAGRDWRARTVALCIVALGIGVDSWIWPFTVVAVPAPLIVPAGVPDDAAILELPAGVFEDAAAMYHATLHGRPTVNGLSGYAPPHYGFLWMAAEEGRLEALSPVAARKGLAIFIPLGTDDLAARIVARTPARMLARTATHDVLFWPRSQATATPPIDRNATSIPMAIASSVDEDTRVMLDNDRLTRWITPVPQKGGEFITADMGAAIDVRGVVLGIGPFVGGFPRALTIEVSEDGQLFREAWRGDTVVNYAQATIDDPLLVRAVFVLASQRARYVRVTQTSQSEQPWAVTEFRVAR